MVIHSNPVRNCFKYFYYDFLLLSISKHCLYIILNNFYFKRLSLFLYNKEGRLNTPSNEQHDNIAARWRSNKKLQTELTQVWDDSDQFFRFSKNWDIKMILSDDLYSHKNGYKMRMRIEFDGNGDQITVIKVRVSVYCMCECYYFGNSLNN